MKIKSDNMSIIRHSITVIVGAAMAYAVAVTTLNAHIENQYVHQDVSNLEKTFVRKDIQALELRAINEKLDLISRKMGITQ